MNDAPLLHLFAILAGLLAISAFFSGSETGMMSLNRYRLKHLAKKHSGARRAQRLLERPDRLLGLILIGNNAVNILAAIIAGIIGTRLLGPEAGIAAATATLTIVMLVFSEVTPKTIAALQPETIAFAASHVLKPLLKIFYPAVWLVNHVSNALVRLLGFNPDHRDGDSLSKEELRTVVDESSDEHISVHHQGMLINILDLEKINVNDIMVPRSEIFGLNLDDDIDALVNQIIDSAYTRVPVYDGDINNIFGFLHMRRVNRILRGGADKLTKEAIKRFTREPYFVPENTPLNTQLINFRKNKRRIALVVDEYGEVQGLVTIEDILEEIVGDFTTNLAEEEEDIVPQPDGSYFIDGSAAIRDINKITGWDLPLSGPKTLNGLVLEQLESIPDGNVCFILDNCRFETLDLSDKMVAKVLAWKTAFPNADGN